MKQFSTLLVSSLALVTISCAEQVKEISRPETQQEVVVALKDGNSRFVEAATTTNHEDVDFAATLSSAQAPFATVVACSDSRVPVELIFDQGFGDLFVIRNAGNAVLDPVSLGSVEYSVNHLGVNTIVVLGHTSCGAITGVVMAADDHHHLEGDENVAVLLEQLGSHIPQHIGTNENLDQAILDNINVQVEALLNSENISNKVSEGTLQIVPALYNISTGVVSFEL